MIWFMRVKNWLLFIQQQNDLFALVPGPAIGNYIYDLVFHHKVMASIMHSKMDIEIL
jgi:hypothetical protein